MARHTPVGRRHHGGPVPHLSPRLILGGVLISAMPTDAPYAARTLRLPVWGSMRHAAHYCHARTSPGQAGDGAVHVDSPCLCNEQP
jgi:hypothetical protein